MGQSGGPVFDSLGAVWGIQSSTFHYELGFAPPVRQTQKRSRSPLIEHQFLNVGRGPSVTSILGLMDHAGVSYTLAPH